MKTTVLRMKVSVIETTVYIKRIYFTYIIL